MEDEADQRAPLVGERERGRGKGWPDGLRPKKREKRGAGLGLAVRKQERRE